MSLENHLSQKTTDEKMHAVELFCGFLTLLRKFCFYLSNLFFASAGNLSIGLHIKYCRLDCVNVEVTHFWTWRVSNAKPYVFGDRVLNFALGHAFNYTQFSSVTEFMFHAVLSPVHTVAEKCDYRRFLAVFGDSRHFLRQSHFSATVWTGLYNKNYDRCADE